jgi:hypothetical protein
MFSDFNTSGLANFSKLFLDSIASFRVKSLLLK